MMAGLGYSRQINIRRSRLNYRTGGYQQYAPSRRATTEKKYADLQNGKIFTQNNAAVMSVLPVLHTGTSARDRIGCEVQAQKLIVRMCIDWYNAISEVATQLKL